LAKFDIAMRDLEQRPEQLGQPHRGVEFQREAVAPGLVRQIEELAALGGASIVDQHVAALEAVADLRKKIFASGKLAQVAFHRQRRRSSGRCHRLGAGGKIGRVGGRQYGLRALARKSGRNGAADAAAASGDDDDLSFELARHGFLPFSGTALYAAIRAAASGPH
jgi:hypothetical protein